ncbi:MAG: hypothetical protein GY788_29580 [bacterium]|nr:hypothetical protein [bacterium]
MIPGRFNALAVSPSTSGIPESEMPAAHAKNPDRADRQDAGQYSLAKILTIWALAAVPMPVLAFVIGPALVPGGSWQAGMTIWVLLIGGMIWQFVLSAASCFPK